jgi:hypothetical protein
MTMPNNPLSEKSNEFLFKVIQQTKSQIPAPVELLEKSFHDQQVEVQTPTMSLRGRRSRGERSNSKEANKITNDLAMNG